MDYHSMDIVELKQHARDLNIKQYYIKRKAELIQILSYKSLPEKYIVEKKTILELREEARVRGFGGILKLSRQQLVDILYPSVKV
jgi:hypothetical protein